VDDKDTLFALSHDARLVNLSEGLLFPLLERKKESQVNVICSKFEGGETNLLTDIAKLSVYKGLIEELKRIQAKGNNATERINNELSRQS
jgi:hypothetical protein